MKAIPTLKQHKDAVIRRTRWFEFVEPLEELLNMHPATINFVENPEDTYYSPAARSCICSLLYTKSEKDLEVCFEDKPDGTKVFLTLRKWFAPPDPELLRNKSHLFCKIIYHPRLEPLGAFITHWNRNRKELVYAGAQRPKHEWIDDFIRALSLATTR